MGAESNGNLTLNGNLTFTYVPNPEFSGSDSFTCTGDRNGVTTDPATVNTTITAVNDTSDDSIALLEDGSASSNVCGDRKQRCSTRRRPTNPARVATRTVPARSNVRNSSATNYN